MESKRKNSAQPNRLRLFVRTYWIELAAVLAGIVGLALVLLEGKGLVDFASGAVASVRGAFSRFSAWLGSYMTENFTPLNLLGFVLVVMALGFILWRIRVRLPQSPRLRTTICPRCGSELRRVRRTPLDRILTAVFFPQGRRYRCSNPGCRWNGLLRHHHRGHRPTSGSPE